MIYARNLTISSILFLGISATAFAQDADTAGHFGFEGIEVLPVGPSAGPLLAHDMDGDGLTDLIIANNYKSRIEIQRQRADASPEDQRAPRRVNELPEHWRFDRIEIPVNVEVTAITPTDLDGDGLMDLLIAGRPGTIIAYRQSAPGQFEMMRRTQVRDLTASRDGFVVADVLGTDGRDELMALAGGRIRIWQLDGGRLLPPEEINAGDATLAALFARDLDGDDLLDVVGVAPDDEAPIRVWLAAREDGKKVLGPQLRFEMPRLNEVHLVQLPNEKKSRLATIERTSRRLAIHELVRDGGENSNGEASLEVHGFSDPGQRTRDIVVMDLDGDSLPDVLTTDREKNAVVSWKQGQETGLAGSRSFPTYASAGVVEAGDVDGDGIAEIFTLSEEEGVVGRSSLNAGSISFPVALEIESGHVPVAMHMAELDQGPTLAVIAKDGREHIVDLLQFDGSEREQIKLGSLSRSPNAMLAIDADQDSKKDILLFTPDKPMTMLKGGDEGEPFTVLDKDDMGQFGLVQSANNNNTQAYDIDGDGIDELLIADKNFIRAVRYDTNPTEGASPGWQVVDQLNADREAKLVSVAPLGDRIVAADREGRRLLIFERSGDGWMVTEEIGIRGLVPRSIHSGPFTGDPEGNDLLLVGDDAFAIAVMDSGRPTLVESGFWRPDDTRRVPHEIASGDVNGDGYLDLVSLDAGEQMADILSFSGQGNLHPMTSFQVFESKIFSAGEKREYEPRQALIVDVSGDGRNDLVLLAHDRLLIYPQEDPDTE
jgi:hypothetical protein